jgi:hypothetical protein
VIRRLAFVAFVAASCSIDPGATQTAVCAPSPDFFVSDVWPRYLVSNRCASGGCHAFTDGHGTLRLRDVAADATPTAKLSLDAWPQSWRENYLSAIQLVRCDAPLESRLLTVPEGSGNLHPPGPVVLDRQTAEDILQQWVVTTP